MTHNNSNSLQNGSSKQEILTLQEYRLMLDEVANVIKNGSKKLKDIESVAIAPINF